MAETIKHLPPECGRGVKRRGLEVRWCLAVNSGERTGCFREVLNLVLGELTGEFFVRSKVAIVSYVSETLSEIVSKLYRFSVLGLLVLIDWGCVEGLVRGAFVVVLSVDWYWERREIGEIFARVVSEGFGSIFPKTCDVVANITKHGVALSATHLHYGRFVDAVGVKEHGERTTN